MKHAREVSLILLGLLLGLTPAFAQEPLGLSHGVIEMPLFLGGGDGDSPWPGFARLSRPRDHLQIMHSAGGILGEATLFAWAELDGTDREIRLARLTRESGTEVYVITDNRADDSAPEIIASAAGAALIWQRVSRGQRELVAISLDRQGRPEGTPRPLSRFGSGTRAMTAIPLGGDEYLIGRVRSDSACLVIEAGNTRLGFMPLGTAPLDTSVTLAFESDPRGAIRLRWHEQPLLPPGDPHRTTLRAPVGDRRVRGR